MEPIGRKVKDVTFDESEVLVSALDEWIKYLQSLDLSRSDLDKDQVNENIETAKNLRTRWYSIRCELEDADILQGRWPGKTTKDAPKPTFTE